MEIKEGWWAFTILVVALIVGAMSYYVGVTATLAECKHRGAVWVEGVKYECRSVPR